MKQALERKIMTRHWLERLFNITPLTRGKAYWFRKDELPC
jgi:hypothetical protein